MPTRPDARTAHPLAPAPRFRPLVWLAACFLIISALTRLALLVQVGAGIPHTPGLLLQIFTAGLGFDLITFCYFALPMVVLLALLPNRWIDRRPGRTVVAALGFVLLAVMLFVALAEWTFWEEFQSRFNFIAVDYLVYTTEVLGNIRESYPVVPLLLGVATLTVALFWTTARWRRAGRSAVSRGMRAGVLLGWIGLCALATWLVDADMKPRSGNHYADALEGNGIYEFFAAYRNAALDYTRYYRTVAPGDAQSRVRASLATPDARFFGRDGIDRMIVNAAPERHLNVVLISVESLSADFSGTYGRETSLTPNLDRLTEDSLLFTRLYATGTRTVRGLEALSLAVPPTPGESIVKRPHNEALFSLARVFNSKGYTSQFVYGGYGAFDNMNYFFANNGYEVHDRAEIASGDIHHSNVWGVADEDLYTLAMRGFDRAHRQGRPFFAHVMTTSNHRPYTFPAGRGPFPQRTREGAVQYTDWALGDFLRRARGHPWFRDTVFVITADHCASSAGKADLPAFRYHIPMWIYAPGHIRPGRVESMVSQIDVPPTVLGVLGIDYPSRFYGVDVLEAAPDRAFISTYQLLGYLTNERLVQLAPHRRVQTLRPSFAGDRLQPALPEDPASTLQAIATYQTAAEAFRSGAMAAPLPRAGAFADRQSVRSPEDPP